MRFSKIPTSRDRRERSIEDIHKIIRGLHLVHIRTLTSSRYLSNEFHPLFIEGRRNPQNSFRSGPKSSRKVLQDCRTFTQLGSSCSCYISRTISILVHVGRSYSRPNFWHRVKKILSNCPPSHYRQFVNTHCDSRGCLDSRNWVEVRKREVSFLISVVHPNTGKEK